jgi:hypothetical protein
MDARILNVGLTLPQAESYIIKWVLGEPKQMSDLKRTVELLDARITASGDATLMTFLRETPTKKAALLLQFSINKRFKRWAEKNPDSNNAETIKKRVEYFNSDAFINNFCTSIPTGGLVKGSLEYVGYTQWFNKIFKAQYSSSEWRHFLEPVSAQQQCLRVLDAIPGVSQALQIKAQQARGNILCWICQRNILETHETMECEHKLAITSGLSHWWLVRQGRAQKDDPAAKAFLQKEYSWSHRCCNRIKDDYDFIIFNPTSKHYVLNNKVISDLLDEIGSARKYDCGIISALDKQQATIGIGRDLKFIITGINANIDAIGEPEVYNLLCRLKLLSALDNDVFNKIVFRTGGARGSIGTVTQTKTIRPKTAVVLNLKGAPVRNTPLVDEEALTPPQYVFDSDYPTPEEMVETFIAEIKNAERFIATNPDKIEVITTTERDLNGWIGTIRGGRTRKQKRNRISRTYRRK